MLPTYIPTTELSGRKVIRTDLTSFDNIEAIKTDLQRVIPLHNYNATQIVQLNDYIKAWHPAIQNRVKLTRVDVDNKITVDYAYSITRDIVGYFLGKPITYTNRKGDKREAMESFNNALNAEVKDLVDMQIATNCSICGVGYRGIFPEKNPRNGTTLNLLSLDPVTTFVVYPSDPTLPPAYAVTSYSTQGDTGLGVDADVYYKVYTANKMFLFKGVGLVGFDTVTGAALELVSEDTISLGGYLPIVEYQNNEWRLGDWEIAISIMDALDGVVSDGVNDIQQAVNSILVALGVKMSPDDFANISVNGFLNVSDIPPGVKPHIDFISQPMNADIGIAMREYLEATLRVIVGVPDRKTRGGGGGDTGDAVFMRDGWQDIDLVASVKEPYFIKGEREAIAVMLYILDVNKELTGLKATDIDVHFNRNKTSNIQSKAQVFQILTTAGMAPEDALDIASLTNNVSDVILRMKKYIEEKQQRELDNMKAQAAIANANAGAEPKNAGDGGKTK